MTFKYDCVTPGRIHVFFGIAAEYVGDLVEERDRYYPDEKLAEYLNSLYKWDWAKKRYTYPTWRRRIMAAYAQTT